MKLRLLPVLLAFFISASLLFGGWFAYQSFAVENPVSEAISAIAGVEHAQIDSTRSTLRIGVTLQDSADLHTIYKKIYEQGMREIGVRKLVIEIENPSSESLDQLWSTELFAIAQAMDTRQYGEIPTRLAELSASHDGLEVKTAMDEEHVFITLRWNGEAKYVILQRKSDGLGVWAGEQVQ